MVKYILHLPDDVLTFNTERELEDYLWFHICNRCMITVLESIPIEIFREMSHSEVIEEILYCECSEGMAVEYTEVW